MCVNQEPVTLDSSQVKKKTRRRWSVRRVCKWGGITVCVMLFAMWLVSGWWQFGYSFFSYPRVTWCWVQCSAGRINCGWYFRLPNVASTASGSYWRLHPLPTSDGFWEWPLRVSSLLTWSADRVTCSIPIWLPFLVIALPTGRLLWPDFRRKKPGCCTKCGYDLTGNVSGTCPECGATNVKAASA